MLPSPCGPAQVWVLDLNLCLLPVPAAHHGARVSPKVSVSARPWVPPANGAHGSLGLVREVGAGRAHAGLGLTHSCPTALPPARVAISTLNMSVPSPIPPHSHEKAGGFECCPPKMPFLPRFRFGKNRNLVFYLSWGSLFAPMGPGPGEQDCDVHNWGPFVAPWSLR